MEGSAAWDVIREGGGLGIAAVCVAILYKEFRRVVSQRDQLFNLLLKSIQQGHAAASTAEQLLSLQEDSKL